MPDLKSLKIVEQNPDRTRLKTEWVGTIRQFGRTIRWTQEDKWDLSLNRLDFSQIEGDYDRMEGYWEFRPEDGGTRFDSLMNYEYNVPLLGALVKKVVEHLVRQNLNSIMNAIKERAESGAEEYP